MNIRLLATTLLGAVSGAVVAATAAPHGGVLLWCASALLAGAVCAALAPHEGGTVVSGGVSESALSALGEKLDALERSLPKAIEAQTRALTSVPQPQAADLKPVVEALAELKSDFRKNLERLVDAQAPVELAGLEAVIREGNARVVDAVAASKVDLSALKIEAPSPVVDLSRLEALLAERPEIVVPAPVVDLSGLEALLAQRQEIAVPEITVPAPVVDLSRLEELLSRPSESVAAAPDLSGLETLLREQNAQILAALEGLRIDPAALRPEIVIPAPVVNVESPLIEVSPTPITVDLSRLEELLSRPSEFAAVAPDLSGLESLLREQNAQILAALEGLRVDPAAFRPEIIIPAPVVNVESPLIEVSPTPVNFDLSRLEELLSQPSEAAVAVDLSPVVEAILALREELTARHREAEGASDNRNETLALAVSQIQFAAPTEKGSGSSRDTQAFSALAQSLDNISDTLPTRLDEMNNRLADGLAGAMKVQEEVLERVVAALGKIDPLAEHLQNHGSQLDSLTGHLETAGVLLSSVPEKLEGSVRCLEDSLSTLRANQAEFAASVAVFTKAAEGIGSGAGGGHASAGAPGTQTAMEDLMEQKAFLDALGKVLAGFSQSLGGVLSETSQRTQDVLVELCARLEGPEQA